MRPLIGVCALALSLLVPAAAAAQDATPGTIVVRGSGHASAAPDRVSVTLAVVSRAVLAADAAADNAERQRAVMQALRGDDLAVNELTTGAYSVQPRTRRDDNGNRTIVGYEAQISIIAASSDLAGVGAIIDAALAAGADEIDHVAFEVSDAQGLRREALAAAVVEATASAQVMARAAGGRLGRLIELSTEELSSRPLPVAEMRYMASAPAPAAPEMAPGEATARASVIGRWEFIAGQ